MMPEPGKKEIRVKLTPTQEKFVYSDAQIVFFIGPMGEGKTFAAIAAILAFAGRVKKKIRGALVRDTHTNIETSTIPDIKNTPFGRIATFHRDNQKMILHSNPEVEMDLFGVSDAAALQRFQGLQVSFVWIEEPAPIVERANAGVPRSVYEMSIARSGRQFGTHARVQITMNPATEEHWTAVEAALPNTLIRDEKTGVEIRKEVFNIPYGENIYLPAASRLFNKQAFKDDPGKYERYVSGRFAEIRLGKEVTPWFNPEIHHASDELPVENGATGVMGWDGGLNCTVVVGQILGSRVVIHDAYVGQQEGVVEVIDGFLTPLLASEKYRDKIPHWVCTGDPSLANRDQRSSADSAAREIEDRLNVSFDPGPVRFGERIDSLRRMLTSMPNGMPMLLISRTARPVYRALNGGWHYKTDHQGRIFMQGGGQKNATPVKDIHSHPGDAMSYIAAHQAPVLNMRRKLPPRPKSRAMGYAVTK